MTPEEYERLKEAEKEHLRKLRKLKQAVRELERQKKVTDAVQNITAGPRELLDENDALVEQLAMDAARAEARLDVAMEGSDAGSETSASPSRAVSEETEAEMRRIRARELVQQMRAESGSAGESRQPAENQAAPGKESAGESSKEAKADPKNPSPLPEKTIGRMKR